MLEAAASVGAIEGQRCLVTQQADSKLQQELKQISRYQVAFSSANVCYVSHHSSFMETNLEVNLPAPSCPCQTWKQFDLPCRHLLAALDASGKLDSAMLMFAPCYTTAAYGKHLKPIRLPSEDELAKDEYMLPAPHVARAERPRKRRLRSKVEQRPKAVYRCRQCSKQDGHNKATHRHR